MEIKDIWNKYKTWIILGVIGLFVLSFITNIISGYNNLIGLRAEAQTQQAQIEAQLQRRFDLVPNLVGSVRGAMVQEQAVFKAIADARTKYAGSAAGTPDKVNAGNQFESALGRLLVVMENYPQLKSIDTVQTLMTQLEGTENRISVARQRYNEAARNYNQSRLKFPTMIIAGMFGFQAMPPFQSVAGANIAPSVNLTK